MKNKTSFFQTLALWMIVDAILDFVGPTHIYGKKKKKSLKKARELILFSSSPVKMNLVKLYYKLSLWWMYWIDHLNFKCQ